MCGIVGFVDRTGQYRPSSGRIVLDMLEALGCRGPDSAGVAMLREPAPGSERVWNLRITPADQAIGAEDRLKSLGRVLSSQREADSLRLAYEPQAGVTAAEVESALGAARGGLEVLCLGHTLDLVKQVGSPAQLEAAYRVSAWHGPLAIGHTRMSTESRIDLSHSQPFWAHGLADVASVHNGHVTNYHQLRRRYEQAGVTFYTDNDSEILGVYLRDQLNGGRTLSQALADSVTDLDGAFSYLVASPEGLGVVRDRFGFKPLMIAETDDFVAVATEEVALRRALPGSYRVSEPPPGSARLYRLPSAVLV